MKRIVIVGCSGSGKSSLASKLGRQLDLPVIHLDALFWRPGWKEGDDAEFRARVAAAHAGDGWVSDGNFVNATFPTRLVRADAVIVLERSRWLCLWRVLWRAAFNRSGRADLPAGCPERPDWRLLTYIWSFERVERPRIEAALASPRDVSVIRLRSNREVADFLTSL